MHLTRTKPFVICCAVALMLTACAADSTGPSSENTTSQTTSSSPDDTTEGTTETASTEETTEQSLAQSWAETSIPAGAYAASDEHPFPVPEGWAVLDPFVEGKLGKSVSIDGSVEYPGDAPAAAATYLDVLRAAGFDAAPYAPGELTNQASLSATGLMNGALYTAILNFDQHADGLQRVSVTIVEKD